MTAWLGSLSAGAEKLLSPLERLFAALDAVRRVVFRLLGPRLCRALLVPRDSRVASVGAALGVSGWLMAACLPAWALVLGPLAWGVPHVVADVRYLLVRPGYHRRAWFMAALVAGMAATFAIGLRGGLLAAAGAILAARASWRRRAAGLVVVAALFAVAQRYGWVAEALLVHLHNFVAFGFFLVWRKRAGHGYLWPAALFVVGSALIVAGAHEPLMAATGGYDVRWTRLDMAEMEWAIAPTIVGPTASRLVVLYAFQQAMHYVVWLRLVPDEARPQSTPRSFRLSYRALVRELGPWLVGAALAACLVFWGMAVESPAYARRSYLQISFFHVYLELVAIAAFWVERRGARGMPLAESS